MNHEERDIQICALYKEGRTQAELATQFDVSEAWIGIILRKAGVTKADKPTRPKRTQFTGVHLSEGVKKALRIEAKREGISMSEFVSQLIGKELKDRGISCEHIAEEHMRLPLE